MKVEMKLTEKEKPLSPKYGPRREVAHLTIKGNKDMVEEVRRIIESSETWDIS